ncbi:gem-associated protein 5 [Polymixia lowei]
MQERVLPASPNWYCCRCSDTNDKGIFGFGARNTIYLTEVTASSCTVVGKLLGHKERVSGFSFCQHAGQSHVCVSSSDDGTVKFWDSDDKVLIKEHTSHQSTITALHWSPADKNLVVSGDEKGIVVCYWFHTGDTVSFFPAPKSIFSLSCSPHTWSYVAVGYKHGMILLIDVSKKGEVVHRLRGHEEEIHSLAWSPSASEEGLYCRPDDGIETNGVAEGEEKGCYLASGSRDQTVRIWSTATGKGVMTLKLPFLKKRGPGVNPGVKERLWLSVHWPKGRPTQIVSSCFSGELVLWDLTKTSKQKWTLLGTLSEGQNHNRIVFNMNSICLQDGRELLVSTSMDREIKCWDLASLDCCWTLPTLGGGVYALSFSPVGTGCLALGVGDYMIRVWNTLSIQNQYDTRTFWQGIKAKVMALAWHPSKEGSLAFGTEDGKVGIYDAFSNKPPQISSSYHQKAVYRLAWGPAVPPMSFGGAGDRPSATLYSCAGEGVILQHDPCGLSGEASDIDKLIINTNNIKHKLSPHTDLSWKPDGKVVAIGNEDGSIEVYQAPSLRLLCSIQQHHKIINTLRWHHDHGPQPELHFLLASGSSNAKVYIHDLRSVIESPADSPVVMTEPYRTLCGHTAKITNLAWSPHHNARLVTTSYDGTAQVWDVLKEAGLSNYRGHWGRLLSVDWSPVDPDVVWTGADDFTMHEWCVSKQEFTLPPKGKKAPDHREKAKTKTKQRKASKMSSEMEKTPSPESSSPVNGEGGTGGEVDAPGMEPSDKNEQDKENGTNSHLPHPASLETARKSFTPSRNKDKPDLQLLSGKKKKARSMLPLSTSMDHRSKDELLQDCITLATVTHSQAPPAGCVPGQGEHVHLGLFSDRQALYRMFQEEEEGHVEGGHYDSVIYLRLWSGDLAGALQLATERGELSDHLLSIAPMAGYEVWSRTVEAYVKQLSLQEQYLKAASHLLSINKLYEAVHLLQSHKLYREAIALVKARLPAEEPVLKELYASWAAVLEKDGHLSAAAKCYLAAGASFDAAKVISRKNDVASLKAAAGLARITGETGLAQSLCLRCAKDLVASQDWVGAQEVLSTLDNLLAHRLLFCVAELLTVTLAQSKVVTWSCVSTHPWAPAGQAHVSIQDRIRDVWEEEFGVSEGSAAVGGLLQDLKAVENPQPTPTTPLKQVLLYLSVHVTQAVLNWLIQDDGEMIKECWQALAWPQEAGQLSLSAELCRLLFPDGDVSICSRKYPKTLRHTEEQARAAADSLQAFVNYHLLYERWWSQSDLTETGPETHSASSQEPTHKIHNGPSASASSAQNGDDAKRNATNGDSGESGAHPVPVTWDGAGSTDTEGKIGFDASVLLSEAHAAYQDTQRLVSEVQERLSNMVVQHGRSQGTQLSPGESQADAPDGTRPDDPETLFSLSTKMSNYQKELTELPNTVKLYPRPDVMECCLVLLHLGDAPDVVPDPLQRRAKDLLRKHGTTSSLQKASRRFLA